MVKNDQVGAAESGPSPDRTEGLVRPEDAHARVPAGGGGLILLLTLATKLFAQCTAGVLQLPEKDWKDELHMRLTYVIRRSGNGSYAWFSSECGTFQSSRLPQSWKKRQMSGMETYRYGLVRSDDIANSQQPAFSDCLTVSQRAELHNLLDQFLKCFVMSHARETLLNNTLKMVLLGHYVNRPIDSLMFSGV